MGAIVVRRPPWRLHDRAVCGEEVSEPGEGVSELGEGSANLNSGGPPGVDVGRPLEGVLERLE
jgi:hypothetical protein